MGEIEKAILKSDLGLTPSNDGKVIRIPIPQLTEERRKELVKHVKKVAEEYRVSVRNHRRVAIEHLKEAEKKKEITDGLQEGQEIVSGGYRAISRDLEDGKKVKKGPAVADKKPADSSG